jgi:hypothetical protein
MSDRMDRRRRACLVRRVVSEDMVAASGAGILQRRAESVTWLPASQSLAAREQPTRAGFRKQARVDTADFSGSSCAEPVAANNPREWTPPDSSSERVREKLEHIQKYLPSSPLDGSLEPSINGQRTFLVRRSRLIPGVE